MEITRDNLLTLTRDGMKQLGLSIASLEKQAGVPKDTVRDFLRGKTQILRADKLQKILRILQPEPGLFITHIIGPAAKFVPVPEGAPPSKVDCPPGLDPAELRAARIEGDAMAPVFGDGWIVYYSLAEDAEATLRTGGWQVPYPPADAGKGKFAALLGKPCVVKLKDGSLYLRTLKAGSSNSLFRLVAYNTADIADTPIEAAYKILFIKPL